MATKVWRVEFPWHKTLTCSDESGQYYDWRPGIRWEGGAEDREAFADGVGAMLLTEIGRYTPPGYRERVFYTRQFVRPSGEAVGHPKLRVMGAAGFTRLRSGYRYGYEVVDCLSHVKMFEDMPRLEWIDVSGDGDEQEAVF